MRELLRQYEKLKNEARAIELDLTNHIDFYVGSLDKKFISWWGLDIRGEKVEVTYNTTYNGEWQDDNYIDIPFEYFECADKDEYIRNVLKKRLKEQKAREAVTIKSLAKAKEKDERETLRRLKEKYE